MSKAVDIDEFASVPAAVSGGSSYPFGISNDRAAASLRRLASRVKSGKVNLQAVETKATATFDGWVTKTLTLTYVEPVKGPKS